MVICDGLSSIQGGHPWHCFWACHVCCALCLTIGCSSLIQLQGPTGRGSWEVHGAHGRFTAPIHLRSDGHEMSWTFQVEGVAVGFMSVCSQVNLQLLHKCFDLGPFHGLCVPHQDDILEPPQEFSVHESSGTVAVTGACRDGAFCAVLCFWLCAGSGWWHLLGNCVPSPLPGVVPGASQPCACICEHRGSRGMALGRHHGLATEGLLNSECLPMSTNVHY